MAKVIYITEKKTTLGQAKLMWLLADILGLPIVALGFITNLDNIKSGIIAILGISYIMVRIYFYVVQKKQSVREKELDLWQKEMDKKERQLKFDKSMGKVNGK